VARSEYAIQRLAEIREQRKLAQPPVQEQVNPWPRSEIIRIERMMARGNMDPDHGTGHVYVIQALDCVKVGVSHKLAKRLKALQLANPFIQDIYFHTPFSLAAYHIECEAHGDLQEYWVRGEWFRCAPEVAKEAVMRRYELWKEITTP
jgi:hypothetical protein